MPLFALSWSQAVKVSALLFAVLVLLLLNSCGGIDTRDFWSGTYCHGDDCKTFDGRGAACPDTKKVARIDRYIYTKSGKSIIASPVYEYTTYHFQDGTCTVTPYASHPDT